MDKFTEYTIDCAYSCDPYESEQVVGGAVFTQEDQDFSGELIYKLKFGYKYRYIDERFTNVLYNPYGASDYFNDEYKQVVLITKHTVLTNSIY